MQWGKSHGEGTDLQYEIWAWGKKQTLNSRAMKNIQKS